MVRSIGRTTAAVAVIVMAAALTVRAQGDPKPMITAAAVSVDQTTLFVEGVNFGTSPSLTLNGFALGGVQVDPTGRHITTLMPAVAPGTARISAISRNGLDGTSFVTIEIRDAMTGALVDSVFNFITMERS